MKSLVGSSRFHIIQEFAGIEANEKCSEINEMFPRMKKYFIKVKNEMIQKLNSYFLGL